MFNVHISYFLALRALHFLIIKNEVKTLLEACMLVCQLIYVFNIFYIII